MSPVTWVEIASFTISSIALIISVFTFYYTKFRGFKGQVIQSKRLSLTWQTTGLRSESDGEGVSILIDVDEPYIALDCEFINDGAKPGMIDDVVLCLNSNSLNRVAGLPSMCSEKSIDFNVENEQSRQNLRNFTPVWIQPGQTKHEQILFKSADENHQITDQVNNGELKLTVAYSGDGIKSKTKNDSEKQYYLSSYISRFNITEDQLSLWRTGGSVVLDSEELLTSRKKFFDGLR